MGTKNRTEWVMQNFTECVLDYGLNKDILSYFDGQGELRHKILFVVVSAALTGNL